MTEPLTVQLLLRRALRRYASRPCLIWEGGFATFAETEARIQSLAAVMQRRTRPEGHIGILLNNSREFLELILACALAGRVRVPLNTRETAEAIANKLELSACGLLFTDTAWQERLAAEAVDHVPPTIVVDGSQRDDVAYDQLVRARAGTLDRVDASSRYRLSFTGGTTGTPKAVVQTHRQELALARNLLLEAFSPSATQPFVASTPLSHASGAFVLPTILGGGSLSWTDGFQPERLIDSSWLGERLTTQTFLVPTALDDLARAVPGKSHDIAHILYGGAPCPASVLERAVDAVGPRLVQLYGQAEAPMTISILTRTDHVSPRDIAGCAGNAFLFVDVAIEKDGIRLEAPEMVGEVVVRSDHVMEHYWEDEQASAARFTDDGGLRTNDLGYLDERGRLWIVGRNGDMLISGGYNVFPSEVERRLGVIDGVRELAAFGVPHPRWGEATVVAVVREPHCDVAEEAVESAARERLAAYERPKMVLFLESLPHTAVGKVSRSDLADRYRDLFATP